MSQGSFLTSTSGQSYPSLLRWGTIQGGELFLQKMQVPPISGKGGGVWQTPNKVDSTGPGQVKLRQWPSPRKEMAHGYCKSRIENPELAHAECRLEDSVGKGQLNPDWVEWLMSWPIGWTSLEPMEELVWLDWKVDPADEGKIPRIATGVKDRTNRLKAIGNGQVPQCVKMAWEVLNAR